jgi:hypothetical protein
VPFRPHLFSKSKPAVIHLTSTALAEDEVFLLLVFIYEEVKRQDKTVGFNLLRLFLYAIRSLKLPMHPEHIHTWRNGRLVRLDSALHWDTQISLEIYPWDGCGMSQSVGEDSQFVYQVRSMGLSNRGRCNRSLTSTLSEEQTQNYCQRFD